MAETDEFVQQLNDSVQYTDIPLGKERSLRVVVPTDEPPGCRISVLTEQQAKASAQGGSKGERGDRGDRGKNNHNTAGDLMAAGAEGGGYLGGGAGAASQRVPKMEVEGSILYHAGSYKLIAGQSFTVFAWEGGVIRVTGSEALRRSVFRATTHNTHTLIEFHCLVHAAREQAQNATSAKARIGPRVVICGGPGTGKHGAMTTLANLAARFGWAPVVADLSVDSQQLGLPGSVAMASWDVPSTVDELTSNMLVNAVCCGSLSPFRANPQEQLQQQLQEQQQQNEQAAAAGSAAPAPSPPGLVLPVPPAGTLSSAYTSACSTLVKQALTRLEHQVGSVVGPSGLLLLVPHLPRRPGTEFVLSLVERVDATHILCLGDDYLLAQLQSRFSTAHLLAAGREEELGLPKGVGRHGGRSYFMGPTGHPLVLESPSVGTGAVRRTEKQIRDDQRRRCQLYFKGGGNISIQPRNIRKQQTWAEGFYRITEHLTQGSSGEVKGKVVVERLKQERLLKMSNVVGALYDLPAGAGEMSLLSLPVTGYVHIKEVDVKDIVMWTTVPEAGLPARPAIVLTDLTWLPS